MPTANQINVNSGDTLLLIGTMKGAFLFRSDGARDQWEEAGPYFPGRAVYALAYDGRKGRRRLWAAVNSLHVGSCRSQSDDYGRTWRDPATYKVKCPAGRETSLSQVRQI